MSIETHFLVVAALIVAWVGFDNHLYYRYVLPVLREVNGEAFTPAELLPWRRSAQIAQFLGLLDEVQRRPWFAWPLRHRRFFALMGVPLAFTVVLRMTGG
jgi:hypothetical protein